MFVHLPPGIHQVALDAQRSSKGSTGLAVDDFAIQPCTAFESECMRTRSGKDYKGTMALNSEYKGCYSWSLDITDRKFIKATNFELAEVRNYCRNIPGKNWQQPNCLIASIDGTYIYSECDIRYCSK
ncbi:hypothetical protein LSH36_6g15065 [Paralvinella palmiformis]|uniref:Kringle domain-containing protein n=1 Tax=Paralvinella palmiformis TaxID=53620 RepID=A0AAD9NH65_9ANNE|nr:hypothetical protein LSH36_6g15065 [Paralvinella palmiformis]